MRTVARIIARHSNAVITKSISSLSKARPSQRFGLDSCNENSSITLLGALPKGGSIPVNVYVDAS